MNSRWQTAVSPEVEARIVAALEHREGDRVPVWECLDNPAVIDHFRRPADEPLDALARAYRELGVDVCPCVDPSSQSDEPYERHETPPVSTPDRLADEPEELDRDWPELECELIGEYRAYRDLLAPRTMFVPTGSTGFAALYLEVGLVRFCEWAADRPDAVESALRRRAAANRRWAETVARERLCPIFLLADDVACKDRLLFSPAFLRRTFLPAVRTMCEPLRRAGIRVIFHSDGNVSALLDDLLDAGIDGLHPVEPVAGMDIGALKESCGDRLVLVGNVDSSRLLPDGSPGEVRDGVRECIRVASPGGGHFVGSSGQVGPRVPLGNVFAFFRACRDFGRYPLHL